MVKTIPKKRRNPNPPPKPQDIWEIAQYVVDPIYHTDDAAYGLIKFDIERLDLRFRRPFIGYMDLFARRLFFYQLPIFKQDFDGNKWLNMLLDAKLLYKHEAKPPFTKADRSIFLLTRKGINYARNFGNPYPIVYRPDEEAINLYEAREWLADRLVANGMEPIDYNWMHSHNSCQADPYTPVLQAFKIKDKVMVNIADLEPLLGALVQNDLHARLLKGYKVSEGHRRRWARNSAKQIVSNFDADEAVRVMAARIMGLAPDDYVDCGKCKGAGYISDKNIVCDKCFGLGKVLTK